MPVRTSVVRAGWRDIDRIVDLITDTLSPTPLGAWLVPDEPCRSGVLAAVARIWTEHALLFGDAFLLQGGTAATVWFHRYRPIPAPAGYGERLGAACGPHRDRFLLLVRALATRRPVEAHNHLAFLAAPGPDRPNRAAAVLAGSQRWMDTLSLPTYAEVFTTADRDLHHRHGYTSREVIRLPGGGTAHPMWRLSPFRAGGRMSGNAAARWAARPSPVRVRNDRVSGYVHP
ncbi:hypothetical protein EV384_4891 [Micromonospora kangleipakensis]|uniref:N-acetyltransferase domain-containing protein n=1 Tax=Micromonospora kangleipakensis TaxID=1077942 RepID=A0A4Q8BFS3_9ACTN|nr:hypothetical protein [Micromonospora kangleipakensis]RZU76255.1 hypothetical protein EV384_4891 [Micromonospora kangleipakensis]